MRVSCILYRIVLGERVRLREAKKRSTSTSNPSSFQSRQLVSCQLEDRRAHAMSEADPIPVDPRIALLEGALASVSSPITEHTVLALASIVGHDQLRDALDLIDRDHGERVLTLFGFSRRLWCKTHCFDSASREGSPPERENVVPSRERKLVVELHGPSGTLQ